MNDFLMIFLSLVGMGAIYWVMWGQKKHNEMIRKLNEIEGDVNKLKEDTVYKDQDKEDKE